MSVRKYVRTDLSMPSRPENQEMKQDLAKGMCG